MTDNITPRLTTHFAGMTWASPFVAASGTFGFGPEYASYLDLARDVGAVSVKGLTCEPRPGNPGRRIAETPAGVLNCIGLENPGAAAFVEQILPRLRTMGTHIIANISGKTVEEYGIITDMLNVDGVDAFEVNISCPNVQAGGMAFGVCPDMAADITALVKSRTDKPVITKLSPNVTDIVSIARAVEEAGADGLSLINTLLGMAIDVDTWKPVLGNTMGGLSGPAIKPVALRMVYQVAQAVRIPILGGGGILSGRDAVAFLLAGATAVSIGTATMIDPRAIRLIREEVLDYLAARRIDDVATLIGRSWKDAPDSL